MSNRAYLYSSNEIPGYKPEQTLSLKGISEYKYEVSLAFFILLSGRPTVCDSLIHTYPEKVSLAGTYKEGVENLKFFGNKMLAAPITTPGTFREHLDQALAHLSRPEIIQEYLFLELGELYDLSGVNDVERMQYHAEAVGEAIRMKNLADIPISFYGSYLNILTDWEELLGLSDFSEVLYFHFPKPFAYSTPLKVQKISPKKQQEELSALAQALKKK